MGDKPVFYCNFASLNASIYDIQVMLGIKKDRDNPEIVDDDIDCKIIMSPQHAKAFANSLNGMIEFYEKNFGEIRFNEKVDESE